MSLTTPVPDDLYTDVLAHFIQLGLDDEEAQLKARNAVEAFYLSDTEHSALQKLTSILKMARGPVTRNRVLIKVEDVFSSLESLEEALSSSDVNHHVDFSIVKEFYDSVWALKGTEIEKKFVGYIRLLTAEFSNKEDFPLNAWLMILFCPALTDPAHYEVLANCLLLWKNTSTETRNILATVVLSFTNREMQQLLSCFHQHLTFVFILDCANETSCEFVFDLISVLYEVNQISKVLSHRSFYNPSMNQINFNIHEDSDEFLKSAFLNYPFFFDVCTKYKVFQEENKILQGRATAGSAESLLQITVSRQNLVADTFDRIERLEKSNYLHYPFRIRFEGEDGVDEGGLTKEFFRLVIAEMFSCEFGMFSYDEESHLWWFHSTGMLDLRAEFRLLGIVIGWAVFNGSLIDLKFPLVFYKKLLGYDLTLEDLKDIFPDIYRNLKKLLDMNFDVSCLGLCFCMDVDSGFGQTSEVSLTPNGENIDVTSNNKHEYVRLYTKYLLETKVERNFNALKSGFETVCQNQYLKLFHPAELEEAICGTKVPDFENLRENVVYLGYNEGESVVQWLWETINECSDEKKRRFLSFVTGSDRAPLGGFTDLHPKFHIQRNNRPTTSLPVAATCINRLSFPRYETKDILKERFMTALEHGDGFGQA